jgi:hypothetical protein
MQAAKCASLIAQTKNPQNRLKSLFSVNLREQKQKYTPAAGFAAFMQRKAACS